MQAVIACVLAVVICAAALCAPAPEPETAVYPRGLPEAPPGTPYAYVVNTNTRKFHQPLCRSVDDIYPQHRLNTNASRDTIINHGYVPCKRCNP